VPVKTTSSRRADGRLARLSLAVLAVAASLAGGANAAPKLPKLDPGEAVFDVFTYTGADPVFARHRPGPGQYQNPILAGFYPDPSVVRVGDDYYLVNSTFAYFPGIPVFHSRDLVHWTQIGNAIDRPGMLDLAGLGLSRGVFAPAISWRDGTFYILNTCVDCGGNFLITAQDPRGPWSDPVWLPDLAGGIDPSLFFDDDGRAYVVNNGPPPGTPGYEGHRAIWIQAFDPKTLKTFGPRTVLLDGGVDPSKDPVWIEGPHILKVDGRYYLTAAEGGTAVGHSEVVLRADKPTGPYAPFSGDPILTQRDLDPDRPDPVTSAGHAQLVQDQTGAWWATFLAVRPYAGDLYNTGRETFLLPVTWKDGWPRILEKGEAVPWVQSSPRLEHFPVLMNREMLKPFFAGALPHRQTGPTLTGSALAGFAPAVPTTGNFTVRETFRGPRLPLDWLMLRNPQGAWLSLPGDGLHLRAGPVGLGDKANPAFVGRRQQHAFATATTCLRFDPAAPRARAGLAAFANEDVYYALSLGVDETGRRIIRLERRAAPGDPKGGVLVAAAPAPVSEAGRVCLKIEARGGLYAFAFGASPAQWTTLAGDQDGTILSTRKAGGFVGAAFGLFATRAD
jgi:xylan 1,4-beta-xylosidase